MSLIWSENWVVNHSYRLYYDKWQPPAPDLIKINLDASLKVIYAAGIGGIVRDCKGRFLLAFGMGKVHWDIAQLELLSFSSLKKVLQGRLQDVKGIILEGENKNVHHFLQNLYNLPKKKLWNVEGEDLSYFSECNNVIFHYVNRKYIMLADYCANFDLSYYFFWDLFYESNLPSSFVSLVKEEYDRLVFYH